jgi:uncharacterized protein
MEPAGEGTSVKVVTDLTVTGKVAQFGRGVLADVSAKLLDQFVECLENDVLVAASAEPAPAPAPAPAPEPEPEPEGPPAAASPGAPAAGPGSAPDAGGIEDTPPAAVPPSAATAVGNGASSPPAAATGPRRIDSPEARPVDLLDTAGAPVAKRLAPVLAALVIVLWLLRRRRRSR